MNDHRDIDLLSKWKSTGDRDAMGQLVRRHINLVFAAARRQVGDTHLAEDVTQAVFILLLRKAHQIKSEAAMASWLFATTRYAAANARKILQRRRHHELQAAAMAAECEAAASESELGPLLDEAIESLPKADRVCVVMSYLQQKTHQQVADAVGISPEAARKRVSRAIEKMRTFFASRGVVAPAAAVTAVLAQQTTASAALVESTLNVAVLSQAAAATTTAATIAKAVTNMIFATKIKLAAAACVAVSVAGLGTAQIVQHIVAPAVVAQVTVADASSADLGNGISVRFVGVALSPGNENDWHSIDGKSIPRPTEMQSRLQTREGRVYDFLFATKCPSDVGITYSISKTRNTASNSAGPGNTGERQILVTAELPESEQTTEMWMLIAEGPWQTIQKYDAGRMGIMAIGVRGMNMTFTPPMDGEGGAMMYISSTGINGQMRLMYTDVLGEERQADFNGSAGSGGFTTTGYKFATPAKQIMQVELQRRPYNKRVTARNVTLDPAKPTTPEIVIQDTGNP